MAAITTRDLAKQYGPIRAVDGLTFEVGEGEVYALLGHNGAGKSTTVEILEGHRQRTSGDVLVLGEDPGRSGRELRDRIGIVLQTSGVEHELTVAEAVSIYGSAYRRRRPVEEVIELVGLGDQLDRRVGHLSGGQRRRLDLAMGIVGRPDLLFLDEPTTGFDPAARRQAWDLVAELCAGGTTVLLTTHYLDEAEHLADRVGVMVAGRLVAEGTPQELIGGSGTTRVGFELPVGASVGDVAALLAADVTLDGRRIEFTTTDPTADVHAVTGWALQSGMTLAGLSVTRPSLEDVFLSLGAAVPQDSDVSEGSFPATGPLLARQVGYQIRTFCRTPIALFFTIALPLTMLVLFNALFGDNTVDTGSGEWPLSQFYTGGLAVFTAVSATFTNLANVVPIRRDEGVLKRWRGTPLPPWTYLAGLVGSSIVLAAVGVAITLTLGVVAYDLDIEAAKVPAIVLTFLVGVASFAALGMAVAGVCPSASAASAVANAIVLPMAFVSGIFIPLEDPPPWLETLGNVLPLKPFAEAFQDCFNPAVAPPAIQWDLLTRVAAWGVVGVLVALRWFRWEPARGGSTTRRRRARTAAAEQG